MENPLHSHGNNVLIAKKKKHFFFSKESTIFFPQQAKYQLAKWVCVSKTHKNIQFLILCEGIF